MKGLKKFQFLLIICFIFFITLSSCQSEEGESTITIMEQDEEDKRTITEDLSENSNSSEEEPSLDPSDFEEENSELVDDNTAPTNNTNIENSKVVEQLPEAKVILPIRRKDTSHTALNIAPCGGIAKMKADTLTNKGSIFNVIWETINPAPQANCTVKISPGLDNEANFTVLYPKDISTDVDGAFPCGRTKGFESQQFSLPEDYVCDQCTVQWAWHTNKGVLYSCSDIIINGNKMENCWEKCQNGGACFNGKCLCKKGFYGVNCDYSNEKRGGWGWVLLILILILIIAVAIYYFWITKSTPTWLVTKTTKKMENQFIEKNQNPIELTQ